MENSAHNYLHKKFKKQLSVELTKPLKYEKENTGRVMLVEKCEKEEEKKINNEECNKIIINNSSNNNINDNHMRKDNNEIVPNQSTNNNQNINNNFVVNTTTSNYSTTTTSSISVGKNIENLQSIKSYISYVVTSSNNNQNNFEQLKLNSFDKNFNDKLITEPTSTIITTTENLLTTSSSTTSSILDNLYTKHNNSFIKNFDDDISSVNIKEKKDHFNEETSLSEIKSDNRQNDLHLPPHQQQQQHLQQQQQLPPDKSIGGKYVCTYCNLVCSKPSVLQKHIRAHTNERPYPCVSCGFSFKTRSNLYKHCRSRTHANRVMGNKVQELNNDIEIEQSMMMIEPKSPHNNNNNNEQNNDEKCDKFINDLKAKPYKPRFHTSKQFFEKMIKENINQKDELNLINNNNNKHTNSDLLSHHINEIINKNNSIVNSNDSYLLKKRQNEQIVIEHFNNNNSNSNDYNIRQRDYDRNFDEPLNLTNKNRKRCMSEITTEPVVQKSLIKELLLKNLYSDMQCPHCKMIFQTVTELELHKLRSCKGFIKPGAKYSRSNSVNVASILTQNKNAFDNMPNTIFPLKSPGPFLGKTRLVESDKNKSFSFDDGLPSTFLIPPSTNDTMTTQQRYLLSPLTLQNDKEKKPTPIKLFGGEVKITHQSGETKSFKIDNKDNSDNNVIEYNGGKLSEKYLVQSSLHSGGSVLTNKPIYTSKQETTSLVAPSSQDIIRVYGSNHHTNVIPTNIIDITNLNKTRKFNFVETNNTIDLTATTSTATVIDVSSNFNNINNNSPTFKYTNVMDFSQKSVKLLNPNLKQPNIIIPGVVPNNNNNNDTKTVLNNPIIDNNKIDEQHNADFIDNENNNNKDFFIQPKLLTVLSKSRSPYVCNPLNLLVNGKVVRYVPGIPGPVFAEEPIDIGSKKIHSTDNRENFIDSNKIQTQNILSPEKLIDSLEVRTDFSPTKIINELKSPTSNLIKNNEIKSPIIKTTALSLSSSTITTTNINELKSPIFINTNTNINETKKFARPNSLALKPTTASLKQHHGLTPTMFNQILISPDTPRVAKKYVHQFLHGNYFSYLGLKSSTKPVYCTLNKTQPFYVPHFKKLSMYSEWRQQDTKTDKLYVSAYDSRQKHQKYVTAGKTSADLVVHSSYKFVVSETLSVKNEKTDEQQKTNTILGGYECNEDYTYIRGRGRGRYVCDQCGIRCKKPSMLKKHIRTHSNDRPYTCSHCNFSFKTKGNLTKHLKSKAHTKNYAASSSSSSSSTQQSGTQSSESDSEDSGMDSSDESTRREEHEAAYGLLSLSQKNTQNILTSTQSETTNIIPNGVVISTNLNESETSGNVMDTEEITHISKTSYVRNKILDQPTTTFSPSKNLPEVTNVDHVDLETNDHQNITQFLGKCNISRPLTYPYTSILHNVEKLTSEENTAKYVKERELTNYEPKIESPKSIKQFHVIQKYASSHINNKSTNKVPDNSNKKDYHRSSRLVVDEIQSPNQIRIIQPTPILKINDSAVMLNDNHSIVGTDLRKRKYNLNENNYKNKMQRNDEVMDLSMSTEKNLEQIPNGSPLSVDEDDYPNNETIIKNVNNDVYSIKQYNINEDDNNYKNNEYDKNLIKNNGNILLLTTTTATTVNQNNDERVNVNYVIHDQQSNNRVNSESPKLFNSIDYDNSAMETLADIATKQVKLEKNTLAKSVASEYLKLATKNEYAVGEGIMRDSGNFPTTNKDVNELIVKPEGSKSCTICAKSFSKPSQLRLHMNIHYLERPFRCDSCSVSFRTKGHLQKHERSASHHNKLSSSPALSSSEPRPFKCTDCNIAFRIHGHLAKHLRSKMHIMKLECLAKIPFGLYAELERSNSLLTEINTADGDQCLESLKTLAKKVFLNDTNKINQLHPTEHLDVDS